MDISIIVMWISLYYFAGWLFIAMLDALSPLPNIPIKAHFFISWLWPFILFLFIWIMFQSVQKTAEIQIVEVKEEEHKSHD